MINVTKSYLPPMEEYIEYLKGIWERNWLTNYGPLTKELERKLEKYLDVKCVQLTANGTISLQIAIKALSIDGEIITTPFSYVATTGAILWENCCPVFVDIEPRTFCIDANKIEASITEDTGAILATHVYGFPCDVVKIEKIAQKHNLRVIYDGAHAFGVKFMGKSILNYGDISICSFHATKFFHTIEGGAVICNDNELNKKIMLFKTFGHQGDNYISMGINGKNSEFHAVMGLCNLGKVGEFISQRKVISDIYRTELQSLPLICSTIPKNVEYNYSYFPVLFRSEGDLIKTKKLLEKHEINTRRYFFPSLNNLPYLKTTSDCPISEDIAQRVLCLPFYQQLGNEQIILICSLIKAALKK